MMNTTTQQTNKRAVLYCRVSTKEQVDEGNSLTSQERLCKEYALKNGYDIAEIFIEQGESAKTAQRTALQALLSYCAQKKNNIHTVIAYKIDRISRNTDDYSQIRLLLKRYGVEIKSTSEFFENTPAGRFMENIIANVAQFDNDVRTERTVGGMKEAMREGRYVWHAPYGYLNTKIAGKTTIVQNEYAPIVLKAFELLATNTINVEQVRLALIPEGLTNKKGKPLNRSYFYKLIRNEIYAGWIIKFGERRKGLFEPIVSQEIFDKVQRIIRSPNKRMVQYQMENPDFPLRRFVMLPTGEKFTGAWAKGKYKKYPYYWVKKVRGVEFAKDKFENLFIRFLNTILLTADHKKFLHLIEENLQKAIGKDNKEAERIEKYIIELQEKERVLIEKNINDIISDTVLKQQLEYIERDRTTAHTTLANLPHHRYEIAELLDFAKEYLKSPGNIWAKAKFPQKLKLQRFKFPQGIIFDEGKFRTPEICRFYNVEEQFLHSMSPKAGLRKRSLNKSDIPNDTQKIIFWNQVANEMEELVEIIKEVEEINNVDIE